LEIEETLRRRGRSYNGYPVSKAYYGSFCMDGLALALWCVYHTTSFNEAVERCVNFLGDADSTGAICAQLAGAIYGVDGIDQRFLDWLRPWDGDEIALRAVILYTLKEGVQVQGEEEGSSSTLLLSETTRHPRETRMGSEENDPKTKKKTALTTTSPPTRTPSSDQSSDVKRTIGRRLSSAKTSSSTLSSTRRPPSNPLE